MVSIKSSCFIFIICYNIDMSEKANTIFLKGKNLDRHSILTQTLFKQAQDQYQTSKINKFARVGQWLMVDRFYYGKVAGVTFNIDGHTVANDALDGDAVKIYNNISNWSETAFTLVKSRTQDLVHLLAPQYNIGPDSRYIPTEIADTKVANYMNGIQNRQKKRERWDYIDSLLAKDAVLYGRGIGLMGIYTDGDKQFRTKITPIKPHNFVIDPLAGGVDIENALFLGWFGEIISTYDIKNGKGKYYDVTEGNSANADTEDGIENNVDIKAYPNGEGHSVKGDLGQTTIETITNNIGSNQPSQTSKVSQGDNNNNFETYAMVTTDYDTGDRYFLRWTKSNMLLECKKYKDYFNSNKYPIMTFAYYPDQAEFWSLSPLDYAIPAIIEQGRALTALVVNSDLINDPPKVIDTEAIAQGGKDPSNFTPGGRTELTVTGSTGKKLSDMYHVVSTPPIDNPTTVYSFFEQLIGNHSGANDVISGKANTKVLGVYTGNKEESINRFKFPGLAYGIYVRQRMELLLEGTMNKLKNDIAVQILGIKGLEYVKITKKERELIANRGSDLEIESEEILLNREIDDKKVKIEFLRQFVNANYLNQKELFGIEARLVGLEEEEIKMITTLDSNDRAFVIEAHKILQDIINDVPPARNSGAMRPLLKETMNLFDEYQDQLTPKQRLELTDYIDYLLEKVRENEIKELQRQQEELADKQLQQSIVGAGGDATATKIPPAPGTVTTDPNQGKVDAGIAGLPQPSPQTNNGTRPVFGNQ